MASGTALPGETVHSSSPGLTGDIFHPGLKSPKKRLSQRPQHWALSLYATGATVPFIPGRARNLRSGRIFLPRVWVASSAIKPTRWRINKYSSLGPRQVLAYRVMGCGVGGDVPFYDLCLFGFSNDLRGYYAGQFRDRRMFATQVEYRFELFWRIGVVGFVGVGAVAPELSKFRGDELLPAGGGGFRLTVAKKNHSQSCALISDLGELAILSAWA